MKTKKLIELLKEADPSGNLPVCVDNVDIFTVYQEASYWDGCLQQLKRDWKKKYYNVVGAKYTSKGQKVTIRTLSIEDALYANPDLPIKVEDTFLEKKMQKTVDKWRREAKKFDEEFKKVHKK